MYNYNYPIGVFGGRNLVSLIEKMLSVDSVWAIVGIFEDPKKGEGKIYTYLKKRGYKVYGVSHKTKNIKEDPCYSSFKKLPQSPDVVSFAFYSDVTEEVVEEALSQGVKNFWFQPGVGSNKVLEKLMKEDVGIVVNYCVIEELRRIRFRKFAKSMKKFYLFRNKQSKEEE